MISYGKELLIQDGWKVINYYYHRLKSVHETNKIPPIRVGANELTIILNSLLIKD
ncbi:hypothetical protein BN1183_BA_00680 [Pantoea ananatis]|nr:hypothetical protein BN1183_BA_00680 [Pantoea ananatis]